LYAILMDRRIRPVWDSNDANRTSGPSTRKRDMLVSYPLNSSVDAPTQASARERPRGSHHPFVPGLKAASISDLQDVELQTTVLVIPCSGSKVNAGPRNRDFASGPSVIDSLPDELAGRLLEARASVRKHVEFDERALIPAVERYSGAFYQAAHAELVRAV